MNIYKISDVNFVNSELYQNYLMKNPSVGYLKIRASAANSAVPISGLKVIVSKIIDNNMVIFYEGSTNDSGIIEKISLPVPKIVSDDLIAPVGMEYDINTNYEVDNIIGNYKVNVYENIYVVQNINIVPKSKEGVLNGY